MKKKTFNKNALEHIDDDDVASPLLRGSVGATGQGRLRALNVAPAVRSRSLLLGIEWSDVAAKIGGRTRSRVSVKEGGRPACTMRAV